MTPSALRDLLAPPSMADRPGSVAVIDDMAEALLQRLRQEDRGQAPVADPTEALTAEAEDALYAWGVACYARANHADAAVLFAALYRRCAPSRRVCMALGASRLALGEARRAADAFAQAHDLVPADAEILFHWAQAECLRSNENDARRLLHRAAALARAAPGRWPDLEHWCADVLARMQSTPSSQS